MSGAPVVLTGEAIMAYRLLAGRKVLQLAQRGVKMRATAAWARQLRRDFLLSPRASYSKIIAAIEVHLKARGVALDAVGAADRTP